VGEDSAQAVKNEIIGIVADAKYDNLRDVIRPTVYVPLRSGDAHFELRTIGDPSGLIPAVRNIVGSAAPSLPLSDLKTQKDQVDDLLIIERLLARLSAAFGLLAVTLACLGLYGLLAYQVTRRTREIGIRMALGAAPVTIRQTVLLETLGIALIGLLVGLPAAFGCARGIATMLYGVETNDPVTAIAILSTILTVAAAAAFVPARRASLIDPTVALRYE
jgi:ABC-type antimicrobial peptide transport system permease subunit